MIGRLRAAHAHRYELPLLTAPVAVPRALQVPIDPYALGLLLGDGCLTGRRLHPSPRTTPSWPRRSRRRCRASRLSTAAASTTACLVGKTPGEVITLENPVTAALRALDLLGTRSTTKFVPEVYLRNSADVRLGVLQGLLDTDGGPVTQADRTCRIQYTTTSPRLRDDVVELVQSLGGVAYVRTRSAEGRWPGG